MRRVPPKEQTAFKVVKTSSSKSDALKVAEFQIAVSMICHSAIRFVDHLGENMVTRGKGQSFMVFNNLAFFGHGLAFFGHGLAFFSQKMSGNSGPDSKNSESEHL